MAYEAIIYSYHTVSHFLKLDEVKKTMLISTVDSRYLEVEGTLLNTSRYPYFDISDVQNWGKYQSNN